MAGRTSAGLLLYRRTAAGGLEVFLVHPGGPFFARKDEGSWSVPKGLVEDGEPDVEAARREFREETSFEPPADGFVPLGEVRQKGGKVVVAWAVPGDCDAARLESNTFELEWPPRSGRVQSFPEVDRGEWLDIDRARVKLLPAQVPLLERLVEHLG